MNKFKRNFGTFGRAIYIILLRWGILAVATVFLMWYLQYRVFENDAAAAWSFWDNKPTVFWYSALILFWLVIFIYGIFHRPFRTIGVAFAIITIITYINNTKVSFRGTPLLPEDFQLADQAGTLTKFIDFAVLTKVILASVLAVALGFLCDYLTKPYFRILPALPKVAKKKPKTKKARIRRKKLILGHVVYFVTPRVVIIPFAIVMFFISANFILNHPSSNSQEVDWLDHTELVAWNQTLNYNQNGFLLGFLYNFKKASLEKPEGYSKDKIASIKKEYQKEAEKEPNKSKKSLKDANYNIVIILDESFYDTSLIQDEYPFIGPDPLPTFHELMKKYPAGYMYSTDYGGGTANIEFEVDTGLTNYWAKTVPYTDILPKIENITSIAKEAKAAGYKTTAIHSFTGGMYKRDIALNKEGFDTFITDDKMSHQEHDENSLYINDLAIYQDTLDILRNSKEKQLVSVVTMQNHAPYYKSNYDEESYHFEFSPEGWDQNFCDIVLAYLESAYRSDLYLGEFLNGLSELDEKTVVLFYGDHAPGIFGITRETGDQKNIDATQLTPYFIWANFEMTGDFADKKYSETLPVESEYSKYVTLPTTTPNCLTNSLYGVLDLKRNAERMLLKDACAENPILTTYYLGNKNPTGKATENYKLLNYDLLGGKQYWLK